MIRAEVSDKNKYWMPKHRFYELKHFCLQYPDWQNALLYLEEIPKDEFLREKFCNNVADPTAKLAMKRSYFSKKIAKVEEAASKCDDVLGRYILIAVTQEKSFVEMKMLYDVPCEKDMWYDRYRKFFYILSKSQ